MSQLIRVATYNIHKCRGLDRRMRPERIAEVLREVDADGHRASESLQIGRHERTRTADPYRVKVVLYQLSYVPKGETR